MREKIPIISQINLELTEATIKRDIKTMRLNIHLAARVIVKNSSTSKETRAESPANMPNAFHEPKILSVLSVRLRTPKDRKPGTKKRTAWNTKTTAVEIMTPNNTVLAFLRLPSTTEEVNISKTHVKMNQKLPKSNMVPKKETCEALERKAERKNTTTTPRPASKVEELGMLTLPSEKRATAQKIIETARPITTKSPLEVSTGILVKGRKKTGRSTITQKSAKKEILSNIFDHIEIFQVMISKNKRLFIKPIIL
jgi:hypothetical protein